MLSNRNDSCVDLLQCETHIRFMSLVNVKMSDTNTLIHLDVIACLLLGCNVVVFLKHIPC